MGWEVSACTSLQILARLKALRVLSEALVRVSDRASGSGTMGGSVDE